MMQILWRKPVKSSITLECWLQEIFVGFSVGTFFFYALFIVEVTSKGTAQDGLAWSLSNSTCLSWWSSSCTPQNSGSAPGSSSNNSATRSSIAPPPFFFAVIFEVKFNFMVVNFCGYYETKVKLNSEHHVSSVGMCRSAKTIPQYVSFHLFSALFLPLQKMIKIKIFFATTENDQNRAFGWLL